jgi:[protein-PII] uridylyltransferase
VEAEGRGLARAALEAHARGIPAEAQAAFIEAMPARYYLTVPPGQAPRHLRLFQLGRQRAMAAWVKHLPALGHSELHLTAFDRPGLLATVAGVLAAHRIDIQHAEVFSTPVDPALGWIAGRALDLFELRGPEGGAIEPARWRAARADLQGVLVEKVDLEELMARRLRASPLPARPLPRVATKVVIDNDSSRHHSVIDVFTADRVGLLHTLSRTFFDLGLTVDLARITTEGHRAADAFYVRNRDGGRVEGAEAKRITDALTQALTRN